MKEFFNHSSVTAKYLKIFKLFMQIQQPVTLATTVWQENQNNCNMCDNNPLFFFFFLYFKIGREKFNIFVLLCDSERSWREIGAHPWVHAILKHSLVISRGSFPILENRWTWTMDYNFKDSVNNSCNFLGFIWWWNKEGLINVN